MQKLFTFAWKQLQYVYADKGLLLFMLITPVALATIMGLAFGSTGGTISLPEISVAVVNLDAGDGDTNYGDTIASILLSEDTINTGNNSTTACSLVDSTASSDDDAPQQQALDDLFNAVTVTSAETAREGVNNGEYVAAVIIPENFSSSLAPDINFANPPESPDDITITPVTLEIYGSGASPISSIVVRSVTESITSQIITGSTAINATISTILENPLNVIAITTADDEDFADFGCAFMPSINPVQMTRLPLDDVQAESGFVQIMVAMGSAQAVFFAIFTMNSSLLSIYNDKKQWILQRLLMTPTPRLTIIGGKILGAMVLVFVQVGLLLLTMTLIASLVMGEALFIWGNNIPLLLLFTLAVGLAVSGLGVFVIGLAKNAEQAQIFGTLTALGMAMLGGAFGFQLPGIEQFSIIYWGVDGYSKLSGGSTDIMQNMLILLAVGSVLFVIGAWLFNRRVEV